MAYYQPNNSLPVGHMAANQSNMTWHTQQAAYGHSGTSQHASFTPTQHSPYIQPYNVVQQGYNQQLPPAQNTPHYAPAYQQYSGPPPQYPGPPLPQHSNQAYSRPPNTAPYRQQQHHLPPPNPQPNNFLSPSRLPQGGKVDRLCATARRSFDKLASSSNLKKTVRVAAGVATSLAIASVTGEAVDTFSGDGLFGDGGGGDSWFGGGGGDGGGGGGDSWFGGGGGEGAGGDANAFGSSGGADGAFAGADTSAVVDPSASAPPAAAEPSMGIDQALNQQAPSQNMAGAAAIGSFNWQSLQSVASMRPI